MKHELLEKNIGLMALMMVLAVSIGGLTQIVPLFFQDVTNECWWSLLQRMAPCAPVQPAQRSAGIEDARLSLVG